MKYILKFFPDRAIDSGLCDWANSSTQEVADWQRCSSPCPWGLSFYARVCIKWVRWTSDITLTDYESLVGQGLRKKF